MKDEDLSYKATVGTFVRIDFEPYKPPSQYWEIRVHLEGEKMSANCREGSTGLMGGSFPGGDPGVGYPDPVRKACLQVWHDHNLRKTKK